MEPDALKKYFLRYSASFETGDADVHKNLELKREHTLRTVREAVSLARAENFSPREELLLTQAAFLHDLSRFEQYSRFRSFHDAVTFDHGERSFELVRDGDLLADLSGGERDAVLRAVRFHNRREVPPDLAPAEKKILLAVRDADKTDIMGILLEHLKNPENSAIVYGLPDTGVLSARVRDAVLAGQSPAHRDFASSLDFLAAKFAWGFDLNYGWTCREFLKRGYMERLRALLPEKPEILDVMLHRVSAFLQEKGKESC